MRLKARSALGESTVATTDALLSSGFKSAVVALTVAELVAAPTEAAWTARASAAPALVARDEMVQVTMPGLLSEALPCAVVADTKTVPAGHVSVQTTLEAVDC